MHNTSDFVLKTKNGTCRRTDPHLKAAVVGDPSVRATENAQLVLLGRNVLNKQKMLNWVTREMIEFWHASLTAATVAESTRGYSFAGDAARIGKPGLDLHFTTVWDHRKKHAIEFAPAVTVFIWFRGPSQPIQIEASRLNSSWCISNRFFSRNVKRSIRIYARI